MHIPYYRRDARHLPHVTRVLNPFEKEDSVQHDDRVLPSHTTLPSEEWRVLLGTRFRNFRQASNAGQTNSYICTHNSSQNMNQPTIYVQLPQKALHKLMPEKKERDLWWAYLAGKPESDWNPPKPPRQNTKKSSKYQRGMRGFADDPGTSGSPHQEPWQCDEGEVEDVLRVDPKESLPTPTCSPEPPEVSTSTEDQIMGPSLTVMDFSPPRPPVLKPREPMPSLLKHIDQVRSVHLLSQHDNKVSYQKMALHLLMYFAHWFNLYLQQPDPTSLPLEAHARWIFALLSKVEDHISADDMSLLRNLARACLG